MFSRHLEKKLMLLIIILLALFVCLSLVMYLLYGLGFEFFGLVKSVTIFQYSGFLLFALLLNYYRRFFFRMSNVLLDLLIVLGFFCVMATGFEALWSLFFWFSAYVNTHTTSTVVLDALTYIPANTVLYKEFSLYFSAKKNFLLLMISVYWIYFLNLIRLERLRSVRPSKSQSSRASR
ncbi:MAG: hypothetical protein ABIH63_00765 [archaeon]